MALIQLSSNLENIKGSIGNITYSKGRSGVIEKTKSHPGSVHPFTPSSSQLALRDSIRTLSPIWKNLSDARRAGWNALAAQVLKHNEFGQPYYSSGFNFFIECNHNLFLVGQSYIYDAPSIPSFKSLASFATVLASGGLPACILSFPSQTTDPNVIHLIYATTGLSAGKNYIHNQYRLISSVPALTSNSFDSTTAYFSHFPYPSSNQKIALKLKPIHSLTGFSSPIITSYGIVSLTIGEFYLPAYSNTYVKATTVLSIYYCYLPFNPALSNIGAASGTSWVGTSATNQRLSFDLGVAKVLRSFIYHNYHNSGADSTCGVKNFVLQGSNSPTAFADTAYAHNTDWTTLSCDASAFLQHVASNVADPHTVNVSNSNSYRYYSFKFADNYGYSGYIGVRKLLLYGVL